MESKVLSHLLSFHQSDIVQYLVGMIARDVVRTFPTNSFFQTPDGTWITPYYMSFLEFDTRRWAETIVRCSVRSLDAFSRHWILSRHELHCSNSHFDRKQVIWHDKKWWICFLDHHSIYCTSRSPNIVATRSPGVRCFSSLSWRDHVKMYSLRLRVFQFENLVLFHLPVLYQHLKKIELEIDFFATQVSFSTIEL